MMRKPRGCTWGLGDSTGQVVGSPTGDLASLSESSYAMVGLGLGFDHRPPKWFAVPDVGMPPARLGAAVGAIVGAVAPSARGSDGSGPTADDRIVADSGVDGLRGER